MRITGHKTRSVADRDNIVFNADIRSAVEKRHTYVSQQPTEPKVQPFFPKAVGAED